MGLRNAQDRIFACPDFVRTDEIIRILDFEGQNSTFGMVAFLSSLFSLRVPSETLFLFRADDTDPLLRFAKQ